VGLDRVGFLLPAQRQSALIRGTAAGADRNRRRLRKTCGPPYNEAAAAL
jgi:hypothetical protein